MQPLALAVLGISGPPQPLPLTSANTISENCSVSMDVAIQLQPLQHGIPCKTHTQKKAKTTPQVEVQPVVDEKEESSPNGSDSEASSSSQSTSTVDAEGGK